MPKRRDQRARPRGHRARIDQRRRARAAATRESPWRDCRRRWRPSAEPTAGAVLGNIGDARRAARCDIGSPSRRRRRLDTLPPFGTPAGRPAPRRVRSGHCRRRRRRRRSRRRALSGRPVDEPACRRPATVRSIASSSGAPGGAGPFSTVRLTLRPVIARTISRGFVSAVVIRLATTRPSRRTVTRSVIAITSCSLWVTNSMVRPSAGETPHHREQAVALLRRQDRGRLVENEHARVAIERLEDFHALAHADRKPPTDRVGVDGETMALREVRRPWRAPRRRSMKGPRRGSAP